MARNPRYPMYKYILAVLDWTTISVALVMGFNLREHWLSGSNVFADSSVYSEIAFIVCYAGAAVLIFQYFNLYKINVFTTVVDHTAQILKAVLSTVVGIALVSFFTKAPWVIDSRLGVGLFSATAVTLSFALRLICFRSLFLWLSKQSMLRRNVLILGAGKTGRNLALNIHFHGYGGLTVVGFIDEDLPLGYMVFGGTKVVGRTSDLPGIVGSLSVQEIIVCLENVDHKRLMEVVEAATRTGTRGRPGRAARGRAAAPRQGRHRRQEQRRRDRSGLTWLRRLHLAPP